MLPTTKISSPKKKLVAAGIVLFPTVVIVVVIVSLTRHHPKQSVTTDNRSAFNTALPSPNLPKGEHNKLEIYMKAQQDSIKARQERAKDPYTQPGTNVGNPLAGLPGNPSNGQDLSTPSRYPTPDLNEQKVNDRLQKIYSVLGQGNGSRGQQPPANSGLYAPEPAGSPQIERLEGMLRTIKMQDTATNPQLQQVNQVLDKLLAAQHPQITGGMKNDTAQTDPQPIITNSPPPPQSDFPSQSPAVEINGFFGTTEDLDSSASSTVSLMAVVHTNETVVSGSIVKLRLLQAIYVNGRCIPANSFIYGPAAISGERITIQLTNVSYANMIFPVALNVYDAADGLEGLFVPGLITRDVVKENMSQGVRGVNIGALDPSLGAQAAAAGIETARNLLSRKIRLVKATLKEGHMAILRPMGQFK